MQAREIGNWVLDGKLDEGGMGVVYLAHHKTLATPAAVKVMSGSLLNNQTFREKFLQEATAQARLRHPHIAQVLDYAQQDDQLFLVMEYLDGGTLADVLTRAGGPVDMARALAWVRQALSGLDYAHQQRVIHRDIKTSNIMLDHHGQAKVTDFGIALMIGGKRLTSTGVTLGT